MANLLTPKRLSVLPMLLGLASVAPPRVEAQELGEVPTITRMAQTAPGTWRIWWDIPEGFVCQVERSLDLESWTPIGEPLTSESQPKWTEDDGLAGVGQAYWRINAEGLASEPTFVPFSVVELARRTHDDEGNPLPSDEGHRYEVSWDSIPGRSYRLERSHDLKDNSWTEVATVVAFSDLTKHVDEIDAPRTFWRVLLLDDGSAPLTISPLRSVPIAGSEAALLSVDIDSPTPLSSVEFFDGSEFIGFGIPGAGQTWSLPVTWQEDTVRLMEASVRVNPIGEEPEQGAVGRFLVADPDQFVPVSSEDAFVGASADGTLEAFSYHPEGIGDQFDKTGAHIVFGAGSRITDDGRAVEFSVAQFARGHGDTSPIGSRPGIQTIEFGSLDPASAGLSFQFVDGVPELCWGSKVLPWSSGTLGVGWSSVSVQPPIGDFALPGQTTVPTKVMRDPASGEPFLVVSLWGDWAAPAGAASARVPETDPLSIYIPKNGKVSASGSIDIRFPDGSTLRGSMRWEPPDFEISIEGKAGDIPALAGLRAVLPESPSSSVPDGVADARLDAAAESLAGYQRAFRALATGGQKRGNGGAAPAPTTNSTHRVGSALEGWAWRIQSWDEDRPGETLPEAESEQLIATIRASAKSAAASADISSAAKLLAALLTLRPAVADVIAPTFADALAAELDAAEAMMFASLERVVDDTPEIVSGSEFEDTALAVSTLNAAANGIPDRRRGGASPSAVRAREISQKVRAKSFARLFRESGIDGVPGFSIDPPNPVLANKSLDELFALLNSLEAYLAMLAAEGVTVFTPDPASGCPLLSTEILTNFPVVQDAMLEVGPFLRAEINALARPAFDAVSAAPDDYSAYKKLHAAALHYANFYLLHQRLGFPMGEDILNPTATELLELFAFESVTWDARVDPDLRGSTAAANFQIAATIALSTSESCLTNAGLPEERFTPSLRLLKNHNDQLRGALTGIVDCDRLRLDLENRLKLTIPPSKTTESPVGEVIDHDIRLTGRYASAPSAAPRLMTMQLSQAGAYLEGFLQIHSAGANLQSSRIRGVLLSSSPDEMRYAYVRETDERIALASGTMTATVFDGVSFGGEAREHTRISIDETTESGETNNVVFLNTSVDAAVSERLIDALPPEARGIMRAQERAPLHPAELEFLRLTVEGRNPLHDVDPFTPGNQQLPLLRLVQNTAIGNAGSRRDAAIVLDGTVQFMLDRATIEHRALYRTLLREFLSTEEVAPGTLPAGTTSYWQQYIAAFAENHPDMPESGALLGLTGEGGDLDPSALYHYEFEISGVTFGVDAPLVPFLGIGAVGLEIEVKKRAPDGSNNHDQPWVFVAGLGQIGAGWGPLPLTLSASSDTVTIDSIFDYDVEDIEGAITILAASATAATSVGASVGISSIIIHPEGNKPTLFLDPGPTSTVYGIQAGVGVDVSVGYVWEVLNGQVEVSSHGVIDDLVEVEGEADTSFGQGFSFAEDDHQLTDCGWHALREYVAEFRHLLEQPNAEIEIYGFTDTTQPAAANESLSERRAETVARALASLLGETYPMDRTTEFGLGERAASQDVDTATVIAGFMTPGRDLIIGQRNELGTIPDERASAGWRQVIILVNNTVTVSLSGELRDSN